MAVQNRKTYRAAGQWGRVVENLLIVVLAFYPLRHIAWGIDFWDTGYHYANFQYMGTRHMDPMWLFSTYLATAAGNFLTKLPQADTLMGMNLYTGLFAGALALTGYFFCTRKLNMPVGIAFLGEMMALSLCWCPTAALYNYLTYLFFLAAFILLYTGLTRERRGCLVGAGIFLGANVLVRFPNLTEAAMILAVWAYDFILWREERRGEGGKSGFWKRAIRHTGWCLLGYAASLAVLFLYIHIRYGISEYIGGIGRLFSMTDKAVDYKPTAMVMGIIGRYVESMYWVVRIGVILLGGVALFAVAAWVEKLYAVCTAFREKRPGSVIARLFPVSVRILWGSVCAALAVWLYQRDFFSFLHDGHYSVWHSWAIFLVLTMLTALVRIPTAVRILWGGVCAATVVWLYQREFFSFLYYSYDSIWHPGPIFLMLTMLIAIIRIFHRNSPREEKLVSGMLILVIFLTSIGGNNGIFPSLNNLFVAAPYTLWECWRFLRYAGDVKAGKGLVLSVFPVKGILITVTGLCLFQFGLFGARFVFAESTGIQGADAYVYNNAVLKNIRMEPGKAQWMTELSGYANENGFEGKEVILYGKIPALSYYLQMPSAFNPWSDLDSYSLKTMESDLAEQEAMVREKGAEKPVVILEDAYGLYLEEEAGEFSLFPLSEEARRSMEEDPKWILLMEYMDRMGYRKTFRNEKFAVYE